MKEIKETCYKGTRILLGHDKRYLINYMVGYLISQGFQEISIPIIQFEETFSDKVGEENNNMMFTFQDRGNRDLCLAPEYTAVIQRLSKTEFKNQQDLKLFYVQECFRGEKPQAGRYRQFTQLGVEILNPVEWTVEKTMNLAKGVISTKLNILKFQFHISVSRGLDYYKEGQGFEITCDQLGAQKQVCGGGEYDGGVGFALGIDRLMLIQ